LTASLHLRYLVQKELYMNSPMKAFNVSEARQHLPTLVDEVSQSGREILITRRGQPLAKLVPFRKAEAERAAHPLRGLPIEIADDFDAPLPELWEALAN
jgi:prevent-host-death family protein